MADSRSRHHGLPTYTVPAPDGGPAVELLQPRLPRVAAPALHHAVGAGERLDLVAWRYFDDPHQFWRVADANPVAVPDDLVEPGRVLVVPGEDEG